MIYRRTWFSCVLWFLFTVLCIVLIAVDGNVWIQYLTGVGAITPRIIYGLFVIPAAALYWIIRGISTRIRKKWTWKGHTAAILECSVFLLIMAVALLVRIMCLNYAEAELAKFSDFNITILPESSLEYFNMAVVSGNGFAAPMDYGISDLYVMLLSVVLSFLGNKVVSAIFLQIILQIVGIILVYVSTRKAAGRLPACIAALYPACSQACLSMLGYFGPEWLFFVLYMIVMLISVSFVKNYLANRIRKPLAVICAVVVGALIGALTYLDLTGASLLVVMLVAAVGKKNEWSAAACHSYSKGMNAVVIVSSYLSWAVVWHGAMYAAAYVKGTRFLADITEQMWMCYRNSFLFTNKYPYFSDIYPVGLLIISASFLVFEFFRSGKEQNYMPWILLCLVVAPTPLAAYGEHGFVVLSLYIWAVLAGLGLQNCLFGGRAEVLQAMIEEINTAAEKAEESEQNADTGTVVGAQEMKTMVNKEPRPRYIENPLPLPKKHVAREMDYQYAVAEEDMKYDVEVPSSDDFDVK